MKMNKCDVESVISRYVNDMLPYFADRFDRWPTGDNANKIADALLGKGEMFRKYGCEKEAEECDNAAFEVMVRRDC